MNQSYEVHRINRMFGRRVAAAVAAAPATGIIDANTVRALAIKDDNNSHSVNSAPPKVTKTHSFIQLKNRELIMDALKMANEMNGINGNL